MKRDQATSPQWLRRLDAKLAHFAPWQVILGTVTGLYLLKNGFLLAGMNAPEPLIGMYNRDFYRATWMMTALDAGFWTAMHIRPNWLKQILSLVFSAYYLVFADQATEKVRRIRSCITLEQMRVSWNKPEMPIIRLLTFMDRPRIMMQHRVELERSDCNLPSVGVEVFFNGTKEAFASATRCILHVHGGGHEDYLRQWAIQTGVPVFSIDYKKAPEFPYPYAIEECFDVYRQIRETNGGCLGLEGWTVATDNTPKPPLHIIGIGDSAGGNIITALTYKIIESPKTLVPLAGLLLVYPSLAFDIRCWLEPKNADLVRNESAHSLPNLAESRDHLGHKSPLAFAPDTVSRWRRIRSQSIQERVAVYPVEEDEAVATSQGNDIVWKQGARVAGLKEKSDRLMMTSQASYISDRILTLDMLRAMVILYLGPHRHPDFEREYYVSPLVAPDHIIAQMPPVYMICGERDPLVDDSIRFAARIRQVKRQLWKRKQAAAADIADFNEEQHVRFKVIDGTSHGFLQMSSLFPHTKTIIRMLGGWLEELLHHASSSTLALPTSGQVTDGLHIKLPLLSSISANEREHIEHWQKNELVKETDLMDRRNQHVYEQHVLPFVQTSDSA
ncbi:Alpha/Beta hydrolase protein [Syncephalis fuscata]|nr:Alpha/Beta hydrolase protein [Syncephalis fuscata]